MGIFECDEALDEHGAHGGVSSAGEGEADTVDVGATEIIVESEDEGEFDLEEVKVFV